MNGQCLNAAHCLFKHRLFKLWQLIFECHCHGMHTIIRSHKRVWSKQGVDFIKVGRKVQIIEIALSKLGARRKARPTPLKSFSKVGHRARIGCKKFMKSTPSFFIEVCWRIFITKLITFFSSSRIASCVGTAGTVHDAYT